VNGTGSGTVTWSGAALGNSGTVTLPYTISGLASGTYNVTFTSSDGCASNSFSETLSDPAAPAAPTITAGGSTTICSGQSVTLTSSQATGNVWTPNGETTASITATTAGTYTVTYTDASGCTSAASAPVVVTVNAGPTVVASGGTSICAGQSATISATGAATYVWDNGAGSTATVTVSPTVTTTYTVTGTLSGCTGTDQVTVFVNAVPTIVASADETICAGESVTISATGGTSYSWDNGAGTNATATVSPSVTTTYTVTGSVNGCSSTDDVMVTVNALPIVNAGADQSVCEGSTVVLSATGASTYSWDNGVVDGSPFNPTASATYTVTGTDANGCIGTDQVIVNVNPLPTVSMSPSTIDTLCANSGDPITLVGTPSGGTFTGTGVSGNLFNPNAAGVGTHTITYSYTDGNGCSNSISVDAVVIDCELGIDENALDGVTLFPNPNQGVFAIEGMPIGTEYSIYDKRGRIVAKGIIESDSHQVELTNVEGGMYYLNATLNGENGSLRFIIAK